MEERGGFAVQLFLHHLLELFLHRDRERLSLTSEWRWLGADAPGMAG